MTSAYSFNLVERPWLPVVFASGRVAEVGILDALTRAHEIRELVDPSPLVTAAAHRLLLAVLHRVFGPRSVEAWTALWNAGHLAAGELDVYFGAWRQRFDLFDGERPFYQSPRLPLESAGPVAKLAHERASGNNPTLFDHSHDGTRAGLPAAMAARLLLAHQAFAVGGLVSREKGGSPSAAGAPLAGGAVVFAAGATLFHTLLLNLMLYDPANDEPIPGHGVDLPAWEQAPLDAPVKRVPSGYLDYLTWQSRRILLCPTGEAAQPDVDRVVIMRGAELPDGVERRDLETMLAFDEVKKPQKGMSPYRTLGFSEARATWRNSTALMQTVPHGARRPKVLDWADTLADAGALDWHAVLPVDLYGLTADKAKVLLWRHERLPLPLRYLDERQDELIGQLRLALDQAERADLALRAGVREVVRLVLSPTADHQAGGREPDRGAVATVVDGLAPGRAYWAALETSFRELLRDLPDDWVEDDGLLIYGGRTEPKWEDALRREARGAFEAATMAFESTSRGQKAAARGRHVFQRNLARAFTPTGDSDAS